MNEKSEPSPLWKVIPASQFQKPAEPAREAVRERFRSLWRRFREGRHSQPPVNKTDLTAASQALLKRAAPEPAWTDAAAAIQESLLGDGKGLTGVTFFTSPPRSGLEEALRIISAQQNWTVVASPSLAEIAKGGAEVAERIRSSSTQPWVIPRFEDFFFRQHNGLDSIRRATDIISSGKHNCLVHCGSWAWAYLSIGLGLDQVLPAPRTLQALDAEAMASWLRGLADAGCGKTEFRAADSGKPILPQSTTSVKRADGRAKESQENGYLLALAAHCRGNAGIASVIWRHSLRTDRDNDPETLDDESSNAIWVSPWAELSFPSLPSQAGNDELFVVHALLIHNGLSTEAIDHVFSGGAFDASVSLRRLRDQGLVELENGKWRVRPLAYASVRRGLASEGFLTDAF